MADNFSTCVECNKRDAWIELWLVSETNQPIKGLKLLITDADGAIHWVNASSGYVLLHGLVPGPVKVEVDTNLLLEQVEQYPMRDVNTSSPAKTEAAEQNGFNNTPKTYQYITVGDLWTEKPENPLPEKHDPEQGDGPLKLTANQSYVLEIKALRALAPLLIDTDNFALVNSYNFALLAILAYANLRTEEEYKGYLGSLESVAKQLEEGVLPSRLNTIDSALVTYEIPFSKAFQYEFFQNKDVDTQGFALYNQTDLIIGIRGTEMIDDFLGESRTSKYRDMITDGDAAQVPFEEIPGTFVHRGFYRYIKAIWDDIKKLILDEGPWERVWVCGHSLGAAGALLLSALIKSDKEIQNYNKIRLFTYGSPRAGTESFVQKVLDLQHYRHVNHNDVVHRAPMHWVDMGKDEKYLKDAEELMKMQEQDDPWNKSNFGKLKKMDLPDQLFDQDDDGYVHHGELVQFHTQGEGSTPIVLLPATHGIGNKGLISHFGKYQPLDDEEYEDIHPWVSLSSTEAAHNHSMIEYVKYLDIFLSRWWFYYSGDEEPYKCAPGYWYQEEQEARAELKVSQDKLMSNDLRLKEAEKKDENWFFDSDEVNKWQDVVSDNKDEIKSIEKRVSLYQKLKDEMCKMDSYPYKPEIFLFGKDPKETWLISLETRIESL